MTSLIPRKIQTEVNKFLQKRIEGCSYSEIAEIYNTTPQYVSRLVRDALQETAYSFQETAKEYLTLELERLDKLTQQLIPDLADNNARIRHKAAGLLLQISDQRAKLLGLNNSTELDSNVLQTKANMAMHSQELNEKSIEELHTIIADYVIVD